MKTSEDEIDELSLIIGILLGAMLLTVIFWLVGVFAPAVDYQSLKACAAGHNEELRETTGVAEIEVDFSDGEVDAVRCASAEVALE